MKIDLLQTFLTIVDTGSLSRAALRLNCTQSTVTARLKTLEDHLGQHLINRHKSGITLTAAGIRLQRYAEAMQDLWRQARHEISLPEAMGVSLNLGVHLSCVHYIKPIGAALRAKYPQMALMFRTGRSPELKQWAKTGVIDGAVDIIPDHLPNLSCATLPPMMLRLVSTRPDSPVIFDPDYIFIEYSSDFARQHAAEFSSADTARLSFDAPQQGLDYLRGGGGSAYLPYDLVAADLTASTLFAVKDAPTFQLPRYLTMHEDASTRMPEVSNIIQRIMKGSNDGQAK